LRASSWLARSLACKGDYPAALKLRRSILAACSRRFGPGDPDTLRAMWSLANLLHFFGEDAEARVLLLSFLDANSHVRKPDEHATKKAKELLAVIDRTWATD
jgi:hypothetical protein